MKPLSNVNLMESSGHLMEFSGTEENKIITAPGGIQTKVILIDLTQPFGPLPLQSQKTV